MATVTFNGTRLSDSDSNSGWGNFVIGGGAPASEYPLAYQVTSGTTAGAVNKKITSSTARQGVDYNGSSVNYAANGYLWYVKCYVSDAFDLNTTWGVEVAMGSSDTGNSHRYNIAGSGANLSVYSQYPAQGGYLITAIDPTIDAWAESADNGGTFDQTAVVWYAMGAQFINGTAKAENVALDAIDYGTGLTLTGGSSVYTSFVEADQDVKANRWGVCTGSGDSVTFRGIATLGTATSIQFDDTTSIVVFPDGYHSTGKFGVYADLQNAATTINDGCLLIGNGSDNGGTTDTRPDYTVNGTSGTFSFSGTLRNFRNVIYTSACSIDGASIECKDLTVGGSHIQNTIIRTNTAADVALLNDGVFGSSSGIHDCDFIQAGSGHAIEITSPGSYTFTGISFSGYSGTTGSNLTANSGSSAAAVFNNSGGSVTITVAGGGTTFSVKNAASSTTTVVANATTVTAKAVTVTGTGINGARVFLEAGNGTGDLPYYDTVTISNSGTTATVTHTAHGMDAGDLVCIRGASLNDNLGIFAISNVTTNSYDYTMLSAPGSSPTGTITATWVMLSDVTSSGEVSDSRVFSNPQPVKGTIRLASGGTFYKPAPLVGTIPTSGTYELTGVMIED